MHSDLSAIELELKEQVTCEHCYAAMSKKHYAHHVNGRRCLRRVEERLLPLIEADKISGVVHIPYRRLADSLGIRWVWNGLPSDDLIAGYWWAKYWWLYDDDYDLVGLIADKFGGYDRAWLAVEAMSSIEREALLIEVLLLQ